MHTIGGSHNCGQVKDCFMKCPARQIAASTGGLPRLPSDLCCDSSANRVATHKILLRIERDIIVTMWVNWSAAKRALLSAHYSTSPRRYAYGPPNCWSE